LSLVAVTGKSKVLLFRSAAACQPALYTLQLVLFILLASLLGCACCSLAVVAGVTGLARGA
jgi:hypothetical protein